MSIKSKIEPKKSGSFAPKVTSWMLAPELPKKITNNSSFPTTSDLQIGNLISNRTLEDSVSGFKLYNTRLSNSELQALTR